MMPETIMRLLLAIVLATCSPAWCACVLAQASDRAARAAVDGACSDECGAVPACVHCVPAVIAATACCADDHGPANDNRTNAPVEDDDCVCCDSTAQFQAARDMTVSAASLATMLLPLPPAIARMEACIVVEAGCGGAGPPLQEADLIEWAVRSGQSLIAQGCLLLT